MSKQTTIYTLQSKNTAPKRRSKGQGTIWQDRNGKWRGQLVVGMKGDGTSERRSFSGTSRDEVQRKLNEFIQLANASFETRAIPDEEIGGVETVVRPRITVAQMAQRWLWDYKRIEICSKTCEWYEHLIHSMIEPHIGGVMLSRVNTLAIQTLINRLVMVDNYAARTVRGVRSILMQSFDLANQLGLMQGNPAVGVKLPKIRRRGRKDEEKVIPMEIRAKVLQAAQAEPMMRAAITTLLFTGLRIGELLALRWSDLDYTAKTLTVDEAVVRRPVYNEQGDRIALKNVVAEPKTDDSYRTVRLSEPVIEALQAWQAYLKDERYGCWLVRPDSFVFTNRKTRKPYTYTGFRAVYYHFLERNGLKECHLNLHSYRHTFATMLVEAGMNPKVVQSQLGHTSVNTTLGVYTHITPALSESVSVALEHVYQQMNA
ncbi:MAG TPA: site-specific integrase [Candidatus Agathobaculum merdipullorum]|nr:site-specific integrase [Candidatus Agathobaculum merdipullorum]